MPEIEIPLTCPECGTGMQSVECINCGYRADGEPLGVDDPPTDGGGIAAAPAAPRIRSGAHRQSGGDGYAGLVFMALMEWVAGAGLLLAGLRWLKLIPQIRSEPEAVTHWMSLVAELPGGGITVTLAGAFLVAVGAFLLMRRRWAWTLSFAVCVGWLVASFFLGGSDLSLTMAAFALPAVVGFFLLILGWAAPR